MRVTLLVSCSHSEAQCANHPHLPALCPLQEIAGHEEMVGQYESYKSFTMPQLYRVVEVGWGVERRRSRQVCVLQVDEY